MRSFMNFIEYNDLGNPPGVGEDPGRRLIAEATGGPKPFWP